MFNIGKILIFSGVILIVIGIVFLLSDKFPYIGRLPGDIYIKRENFTFYFPVTTLIIVSLVLSLLMRIFRK